MFIILGRNEKKAAIYGVYHIFVNSNFLPMLFRHHTSRAWEGVDENAVREAKKSDEHRLLRRMIFSPFRKVFQPWVEETSDLGLSNHG